MKRFVQVALLLLSTPSLAGEEAIMMREPVRSDAVPAAAPLTARIAGHWQLQSDDPSFGGASGLLAGRHGLTLVTDAGRLFDVDVEQGKAVRTRPLPAACLNPLGQKRTDAEAMTLSPDGQEWRVAIERVNMLCAWHPDRPDSARLVPVEALQSWRGNRGAEAMAALAGMGTVIIGERADEGGDGARPLLWFHGDPADPQTAVTHMHYHPPAGFKPGDAAFLPDGRLVILNRQTRLGRKAASILTLHPPLLPIEGGTLEGKELMRIENAPYSANYEGMALERRPGGITIWLVSDDNFRTAGGTKLLKIEMDDSSINFFSP